MPNSRPASTPAAVPVASTLLVRAAAVVVLLVGFAAAAVLGMAAIDRRTAASPGGLAFVPAALTFMATVAAAGLLEAGARVVARPVGGIVQTAGPAPVTTAAAEQVVERLRTAVEDLRATTAMIAELRPPVLAGGPPAGQASPVDLSQAEPSPTEQSAALVDSFGHEVPASGESPIDPAPLNGVAPAVGDPHLQQLERMVKLLEEMKELSLLDDSQRQARRKQVMDRRKHSRLEEAAKLIHRRQWEQADALMHLIESLHPGDPEVLGRRNELDDARIMAQSSAWDQLTHHADDLMALSRYDEAIASVNTFLEAYPTHTDAQQLAQRITYEQQVYTDRAVTALYGEIRTAVDGRQWRMALDGTQRFLNQFPEHARAEKIRQQLKVIQKNAEVEERHELEDRLQELIRVRRYNDAAALCDDLVTRFPDAPQTANLEALRVKLRERWGDEAAPAGAEIET